jgi:hypothetical protein
VWWLDSNVSEDHDASIFRVHGSPKRYYPTTTLYGVTPQKTTNIFIAVNASNAVYLNVLYIGTSTKVYGGKTHYTDSQNSDTTAPSGRELYHLQFSLQAASPETFGYTLVLLKIHRFSYLEDRHLFRLYPREKLS